MRRSTRSSTPLEMSQVTTNGEEGVVIIMQTLARWTYRHESVLEYANIVLLSA